MGKSTHFTGQQSFLYFFGNNIADVYKSSLHQRCCTLIIVTTNEH